MRSPFQVLDQLVRRSVDQDHTLVARPHRARALFFRSATVFALVFAASVAEVWTTGPVSSFFHAVVAGYIGWTAFYGFRRATAYRDGWLDGRGAMIMSLPEAMHRGLGPDEWLMAEYERDLMVMGVRPARNPEEE